MASILSSGYITSGYCQNIQSINDGVGLWDVRLPYTTGNPYFRTDGANFNTPFGFATGSVTSGVIQDSLWLRGFSFSIPADATLIGYQINLWMKVNNTGYVDSFGDGIYTYLTSGNDQNNGISLNNIFFNNKNSLTQYPSSGALNSLRYTDNKISTYDITTNASVVGSIDVSSGTLKSFLATTGLGLFIGFPTYNKLFQMSFGGAEILFSYSVPDPVVPNSFINMYKTSTISRGGIGYFKK